MNQQIREFIRKARILFIIDGCQHCAKFKEFIERENLTVPLNKRVRVINMDASNSLGLLDYSITKLFDQYMDGNFPFLFFDGKLLQGANTKEECEAFIRASFTKDLIVPKYNPHLFNKDCRYIIKGKRKILKCK
ncbi:MAG: hypothetical protein PHF86_12525 [Candidatus Nanoarchaeia archaeon]|nr:hypothetical protein [Candidatus Nanoarchaeia archaeon]